MREGAVPDSLRCAGESMKLFEVTGGFRADRSSRRCVRIHVQIRMIKAGFGHSDR